MARPGDEDERFDVILIDLGPRKINVIKLVRERLGLELVEAKNFVESLPQTLARDLSSEEARSLKGRFEQAEAGIWLKSRGS